MTFSKKTTPLHLPIQNILLAVNPFHCFFEKSWWAGKNDSVLLFSHVIITYLHSPPIYMLISSVREIFHARV